MSDPAANSALPLKPTHEEMEGFFNAARYEDKMVVAEFLDKYGVGFINEQDSYGNTALILSAVYRRKDTVALLLEKGAALDIKNRSGNTAPMLAGMQEIIDLFRQYSEMQGQRQMEQQKQKEQAELARAAVTEARIQRLKQLRRPNPVHRKPG